MWDKIKLEEVRDNVKKGVIKKEEELVGDTTYYIAYSGFEVVKYVDDKGKEQKKSQSKVTKNCRCKDRESCGHEWELCDDGAVAIVKSSNQILGPQSKYNRISGTRNSVGYSSVKRWCDT